MNKAEAWIGDRMTVRRWLSAVAAVGVLAAAVGYCVLRDPDDAAAGTFDDSAGGGGAAAGEQRPARGVRLTADVGSVGTIDGLATVSLTVLPLRQPADWTVTVRTDPSATATPREIDLKGAEVRPFIAAIDEAVRRHDPESDVIVSDTTIHAVETSAGEFRYDLKCVGVVRLNADRMSELKQALRQAEAQRAWLVARTVALRNPGVTPAVAAAAAVSLPAAQVIRPGK